MIANKMESNGVIGKIMVSGETKKLLERKFPGMYIYDKHVDVNISSVNRIVEGFLINPIENHLKDKFDEIS